MEKKLKDLSQRLGFPVRSNSFYDVLLKRISKLIQRDQELVTHYDEECLSLSPMMNLLFFSDGIVHRFSSSVLMMQQNFLIPRPSLLNPEYSPACILERMTGKAMVSPKICLLSK